MLESLDKVNIKDLTIVAPVLEDRRLNPLFDPRRDLTPEDLEMLRSCEAIFLSDNALSLSIIYPGIIKEIHESDEACKNAFDVLDTNVKFIKRRERLYRSVFVSEDLHLERYFFSKTAAEVKKVFPEQSSKLDKYLKSQKNGLLDSIESRARNANWLNYLKQIRYFNLLYPEDAFRSLDDGIWESVESYINTVHLNFDFAEVASILRIYFPDKFSQVYLGDEEWSILMENFADVKRGSKAVDRIYRFIDMAADLTILAAEEVGVTETGEIIVHPVKPTPPQTDFKELALPVRRAF